MNLPFEEVETVRLVEKYISKSMIDLIFRLGIAPFPKAAADI